jgi:hypothetical protein
MNIRRNKKLSKTRTFQGVHIFASTVRFFRAAPVFALLAFGATGIHAQTSHEIVGHVEGRDFTVENAAGTVAGAGELAGILTSGARLVVRSGQARILLEGGGDVVICGAAELQVLKAQGSLTIALDYGTLRVHVKKSDPVSVFTPLVLATTVSIGEGERDVTVGLEQTGLMCVRAKSGAVRIAQQLSGESLLVPQFGGLTLSGGQLNAVSSLAPGCTCDADSTKLAPWRPSVTQPTVVASAPVSDPSPDLSQHHLIGNPRPQSASPSIVGAPPAVNGPIYTAIMPPFVFNAENPDAPPEPELETIALVRSVRVREDTIIHGTVEPRGNSVNLIASKKSSVSGADHSGVMASIGRFFRKLFGVS